MTDNSVNVTRAATHVPNHHAKIKHLIAHIRGPERHPHFQESLHDILDLLNESVRSIKAKVDPVPTTSTSVAGSTTTQLEPLPPTAILVTYTPNDFILSWVKNDQNAVQYEVRQGTIWASANFQTRTQGTSVALLPLVAGTYTYLVKAIDINGNYSVNFASITITIPLPVMGTLSATVIDNNVLLNWTPASSTWAIDHYNVYQTPPGLSQTLVGRFTGTFAAIFETVSGTYTFAVEPVDIAGNVGPQAVYTTLVNPPPDYNTFGNPIKSGFTGAIVNGILFPSVPEILFIVDTGETWGSHFTSRGWTSPQDQVNAGYPDYIMPGLAANNIGTYTETFDIGSVLNNVIANVSYSLTALFGGVNVNVALAGSVDNIVFTPLVAGQNQFFQSIRFLQVQITVTPDSIPPSDDDFAYISNLTVNFSVKRVVDSGQVLASANDPSPGTPVFFTKPFRFVDSITLDNGIGNPTTPIWNFNFPQNPGTTIPFYVEVFDSAGRKVNQLITWHARGVI